MNFGASSLSDMNALPEQTQAVGSGSGRTDGGTGAVSRPTAVSGRDPAAQAASADAPTRRQDPAPAAAASDSGRAAVDWESVAKTVWLTGAAAVGAVFLAANVRLYGKLRRSRRKVEQPLSALPVYESCAVETPCLFGLIHPAVYVTPETLADGEALRYSLAHEQTHCRHGDHLWALLRGRAWPCTGITRWSGGRRSDPAGTRSLPAMKPSFAAWARASVPPTAAPWFA